MDDLDLRNLVLATLERLPLIAASHIGVAVRQGVVVLTGHVVDKSHKAVIEFAVINLPEVKGLAQKIHVCADLEFLDSDEEIARRMVRMIEWNISNPQNDLRVRVEDRWVTLTGHVGCSQDLEKAEQFAKIVRGCAGFSNNLAVSNQARVADASREAAA
ncbi:BON domain-containing protein [Rhizobium herbae]|uniref:Osmotically-inducible protein OsmY n=1 Tax=Rhizobium herbae TaxID=508661 RepID=A0ABS4EPN9_9HYPH|nr:BON domain-containing protein [Rhizobium herbae]MBP1859918.1 osmotically-inducible protein OsmY [Rhizobium herbae]